MLIRMAFIKNLKLAQAFWSITWVIALHQPWAIDVKTMVFTPKWIFSCWFLCRRLTVSFVYKNQKRLNANKHKPHPQGFEQPWFGLSPPSWICISVHKPARYQMEIILDMQKHQQASVSSQAERNSHQLKTILMLHNVRRNKPTHFRDVYLCFLELRLFGTKVLKSNIFILFTWSVDLGIKLFKHIKCPVYLNYSDELPVISRS